MPATISSLPPEILDYVCQFLASDYPQGIYDAVLVNRLWYLCAAKYRYQGIHINIVNRERLSKDLDYLKRDLQRVSGFLSVRQLTVRGRMPPLKSDNGKTSYLDEWANDGHGPEDDLTRLDHVYNQSVSDLFDRKYRHETEGWDPLVDLLKHLTGLQSLTWACETPIPVCVLQILQEDIRSCKIHHRTFKLPSLHQEVTGLHDIEARDYALAGSKCLSSILVPLSHHDTSGCVEYNQEAVQKMAAGLAPNLTHVHIVYRCRGWEAEDAAKRGRPPWNGFFFEQDVDTDDEKAHGPSMMHLQCWSLSPASLAYFRIWEGHIAFSELQVLQLWQVNMETLSAARGLQLSSLRTLALDLQYPLDLSRGFDYVVAYRLDGLAAEFLSEMAVPLQNIHLSGIPTCDRAFLAALEHHGKTLLTISLVSPGSGSRAGVQMTASQITEIHRKCPKIRDLRLPIQRTRGDSREVGIYKALGIFSYLTNLLLQLDLTDGLPLRHQGINQEDRVLNTFVNAAVDETLVRAMLHKIVAAGAHALETFKVIVNLEVTDSVDLVDVAQPMARKWKCTRFPAFKDKGAEPWQAKAIVEEMGARARTFSLALPHFEHRGSLGPYEPLFRRLWGKRSPHWDNDWQSFPLS
ncbi:hypothetical protein BJX70DRAFT_367278 [Aspergillus crustosus]